MSNSKITLSILIVILIFIGGFFLLQNSVMNIQSKIPGLLSKISDSAAANDWESAGRGFKDMEATWDRGKYLIALNYAEPDYLLFMENMARLDHALQEHDQSEVKKNAVVLKTLWLNLTKFVPLP